VGILDTELIPYFFGQRRHDGWTHVNRRFTLEPEYVMVNEGTRAGKPVP
jgi:hypothetical protein